MTGINQKKTEDGENMKKKKKEEVKVSKFTEDLTFSIGEAQIDEAKRTVRVCALAPCLSKNNRFYSASVVEEASGTLTGKKSFADHDQRDTKNLIGKIVSEDFKDGKLYADIKISKASGISRQTYEKLLDGTIDSVSIAADGTTKRMKMEGKYVDEVTNLKIHSVDFVTEGGVPDAKVLRVFEDTKTIPTTEEVEDMIETVEQLQEKHPELVAEVLEPIQTELEAAKKTAEEATKRAEAAEFKLIEKEMADYKETKIAAAEVNDKVKAILRTKVTGKTKEDIDKAIKSEIAIAKSYEEAFKVAKKEAKIEGVPEVKKEEKKAKVTSSTIRAMDIAEAAKGIAIDKLWNTGEEACIEYLKSQGVQL